VDRVGGKPRTLEKVGHAVLYQGQGLLLLGESDDEVRSAVEGDWVITAQDRAGQGRAGQGRAG